MGLSSIEALHDLEGSLAARSVSGSANRGCSSPECSLSVVHWVKLGSHLETQLNVNCVAPQVAAAKPDNANVAAKADKNRWTTRDVTMS